MLHALHALPSIAHAMRLFCQVSSVSGQSDNQDGEILMALGYLASYQHMGSFSIDCVAGCVCEGVQNHTASHGWPSSYYKMVTLEHDFPASLGSLPAARCLLSTSFDEQRGEVHHTTGAVLVDVDLPYACTEVDRWIHLPAEGLPARTADAAGSWRAVDRQCQI